MIIDRLRTWIALVVAAIVVVAVALGVVEIRSTADSPTTASSALAPVPTSTEVAVVPTTMPTSTTVETQPCVRRTVQATVTVRAEPRATARADASIQPGRLLCVLLTSKSGRWIYVRYAPNDADPAVACTGALATCTQGWVSKRFTIDVTTRDSTPQSEVDNER